MSGDRLELIRDIEKSCRRFRAPVLALGNFDGVHRGHQAILERLVAEARRLGGEAVVMTFAPHPEAVLRPGSKLRLLSGTRDKIERIAAAGIDVLLLQRFNRRFAAISAEDFFRSYLVGRIGVAKIVAGYRVGFGHARRGDARMLERLGREAGVEVAIVGPIEVEGYQVSSSAIRRFVERGEMELAAKLLGRPHSLSGRVVRGEGRGATLGFPTANVGGTRGLMPPAGVYAVRVEVSGKEYNGIANLGTKPTFGGERPGLEAHIFDFEGDLYGRRIRVSFISYLRQEAAFPSPQALARQIAADAARARSLLGR